MNSRPAIMPETFVMVRHGESEGQAAAAQAKDNNLSVFTDEYRNTPSKDWRLTERGVWQAAMAGLWIAKYIVPRLQEITYDEPSEPNHIRGFDIARVSPFLRAIQTAGILSRYVKIEPDGWSQDLRLREQSFGDISTMPHEEYKEKYPDNYRTRKTDKLFWRSPGGDSVSDLVALNQSLHGSIIRRVERGARSAITVGHNRQVAAAQIILEGIDPNEWPEFITQHEIDNAQIVQYDRRNPYTGELGRAHRWVRSTRPWSVGAGGRIEFNDNPGTWRKFDPADSRLTPEQCVANIQAGWLEKLPPPTFPW